MTAQAFERWRGRLVWRTPDEVHRLAEYQRDRALLGRQVETTSRRGTRRHVCTVVAVWKPGACVDWRSHKGCRRPMLEWASALSRVRWENAQHREGGGALILRIDASTSPNMLGRYLSRGADRVHPW